MFYEYVLNIIIFISSEYPINISNGITFYKYIVQAWERSHSQDTHSEFELTQYYTEEDP